MCGIVGFCSDRENYTLRKEKWSRVLMKMNQVQSHRGPDDNGWYLGKQCGLGHVRLAVIDPVSGQQPVIRKEDADCVMVYNGELYNLPKLRQELEEQGLSFETKCDAEVVLAGYRLYGEEFIKQMNGIFAFAVWEESKSRLLLCRDRCGVKPLFYTRQGDTLIFSSEIKGLLAYPGMKARVDQEGLCEVLGLGPAKTYGSGVFQGIREVLPGHYLIWESGKQQEYCYWQLISQPHEEDYKKTVEHTSYLVTDAIRMQMLSDVPICTFLSGGVDSSLVTAVCSEELKQQGKVLDTYSFDFVDNQVNFKANAFQPSQDRPWVDRMKEFAGTRHHYLECGNQELYGYLFQAVDARDLPCMADVESSMLYFCSQVSQHHKVALTGECADEIFGGYPWFHKKECFEADCFPWSMDFGPRTMLLKEEVRGQLPLEEYAREAYHRTIKETPRLEGEAPEAKRRREISYLNLKWFMQTLLDRMDRTSMHTGLEARVPFADYRIMEYLWNVPWEMKCKDGIVKGLLRAAGEKHLPKNVLYRRKSPYPKTYDPAYEQLLKTKIREVVTDTAAPIRQLIDPKKLEEYLACPSDYGRPFYGQLMAGPQLLAYWLQVNYWLEHYHIELV